MPILSTVVLIMCMVAIGYILFSLRKNRSNLPPEIEDLLVSDTRVAMVIALKPYKKLSSKFSKVEYQILADQVYRLNNSERIYFNRFEGGLDSFQIWLKTELDKLDAGLTLESDVATAFMVEHQGKKIII